MKTSKSATIPALRVEPALREAVESILSENETLSSFAEQAIRAQLQYRQAQADFVNRALASRDKARETGVYIAADNVLEQLSEMLTQAKQAKAKR